MILDVNNGLDGDQFGAIADRNFRDHTVNISIFVTAKLEGEKSLVCLANGNFKAAFLAFDFQFQRGLSLLFLLLQRTYEEVSSGLLFPIL